jgi:hypothetical protein
MKLLEDALLLFQGDTWSRVGDTDHKVAIHPIGANPHLTPVSERDSIANEIEQDLGEPLLVAHANW